MQQTLLKVKNLEKFIQKHGDDTSRLNVGFYIPDDFQNNGLQDT